MRAPLPSARLRVLAGVVLACAALGCRDRTPKVEVTTSPPSTAPLAASTAPRPIALDPPNGATGVDPARTTLTVTFDREMDPQGWAWVIEGPMTAPELGDSAWDAATRVNTVQATLQPGREYVVWVNSPQYLYFKDRFGTPALPTRWTFSTSGTPAPAAAPSAPGLVRSTAPTGPPRVVELSPPNGATDVDPSLTVLRATFDRPMEGSWSWVTEGQNFPDSTGAAYFEPDQRTAAMPVKLEPGRTYVIWLNSEQYQLFRDLAGTPAQPLRWAFRTRAAGPESPNR